MPGAPPRPSNILAALAACGSAKPHLVPCAAARAGASDFAGEALPSLGRFDRAMVVAREREADVGAAFRRVRC